LTQVNSEGGEHPRNIERLEPYSHPRAQLLLEPTAVLRFHCLTRDHATHKLSFIVKVLSIENRVTLTLHEGKPGSRANPLCFATPRRITDLSNYSRKLLKWGSHQIERLRQTQSSANACGCWKTSTRKKNFLSASTPWWGLCFAVELLRCL